LTALNAFGAGDVLDGGRCPLSLREIPRHIFNKKKGVFIALKIRPSTANCRARYGLAAFLRPIFWELPRQYAFKTWVVACAATQRDNSDTHS
jgi:hypothetical protein